MLHCMMLLARLSTVHPPDKCVVNSLIVKEGEKDGIGSVDTQGFGIGHEKVVSSHP